MFALEINETLYQCLTFLLFDFIRCHLATNITNTLKYPYGGVCRIGNKLNTTIKMPHVASCRTQILANQNIYIYIAHTYTIQFTANMRCVSSSHAACRFWILAAKITVIEKYRRYFWRCIFLFTKQNAASEVSAVFVNIGNFCCQYSVSARRVRCVWSVFSFLARTHNHKLLQLLGRSTSTRKLRRMKCRECVLDDWYVNL